MLAAVLAIFAFGCGCALTYFLMDGTRKQALLHQGRLNEREHRLREEMERLGDQSVRQDATERSLSTAAVEHNRKVAAFQQEVSAFEGKKISYSELESENRILKTDMRSELTERSHLESSVQLLKREVGKLKSARDELGGDLLSELWNGIRRSLSPSNYPNSKHRLQKAFARVRKDGVRVPEEQEKKMLSDLHSQYELAVRAALERDHQASLREQIREEQRREKEAQEEIERAEREKRAIE